MATPSWHISGQYYENCSCDFVCPCVAGQLAVKPTKGSCTIAMAFQVGQGSHGTVSLDGLGFIVLLLTPEEMGKGNWSVGVIVDAGPVPSSAMPSPRSRADLPVAPWPPCHPWSESF